MQPIVSLVNFTFQAKRLEKCNILRTCARMKIWVINDIFLIRRRRPTNNVSPGLYLLKFKLDQRVSETRSRIHSETLHSERLCSSLHREKHAHHRCSSLDCFGKSSLVIMRWIFPVGTELSMCRLVLSIESIPFKVFESENEKRITENSSVILIRHVSRNYKGNGNAASLF